MVTKSASSASNNTSASTETLKKTSNKTLSSKQLNMNNVLDQIKKADKDLDNVLAKQAFILKLERRSGIKKTHMVYGLAALAGFFLLYRFATTFVVSFVLFAYPMYLTLEAVESHDKAKDAHILSYWSVIAFVHLLEAVFPFIRRYIPFYNLLKLTLSVYLYLPQTKGSLIAYDMAFKPVLAKIKSSSKQSSNKSVPLKKSTSNLSTDSAEN